MLRWKCRTDLMFLCNEVLDYKDVCPEVHGELINRLQKFPVPTKEQFEKNDVWTGTTWIYKPIKHILDLPGKRRRLILDARSHLKTTINVQAHTIQWLLNYPDIAMAIFQSNLEKGEAILREIKHFFQYNEKFRRIFPEHCPQTHIDDWGVKSCFTTEARGRNISRREPSVTVMSVEKGTAGMHYEVMKFTDIVEPGNSGTKERCQDIKDAFYVAEWLLVSPVYWIDVEGTRYSYADLYGALIEKWEKEKKLGVEPEYEVYCRSVYRRKTPDGSPQKFTPDELDEEKYPFLLDPVTKKRVPWWPYDREGHPRFPVENLERSEAADPYIFSAQMLNAPRGGIGGQDIFPLDLMQWIPREKFRQNVAISHRTVTVDTAETDGKRSNHSAIVVAAWDRNGRAYIEDIVHGKFLADKLIQEFFKVCIRYRPTKILIERTSYVRGLMVAVMREMQMRNLYLPIELIPRETQISKQERITNTLQPYWKQGLIRFVKPSSPEQEAAYEALIKELKTFPGQSDDILDAIADQFQNKDWFGKEFNVFDQTLENLQGPPGMATDFQWNRWLGVDAPWDDPEEAPYYDDANFGIPKPLP